MSINGIGGYNPYIYNIYNNNQTDQTGKTEEVKPSIPESEASVPVKEETVAPKRTNASLDDIQATFNNTRGKGLNLVSAGSDKEDIDVGKAVSGINRDVALERYRYFVDSAKKK